jgi:4-alpha-glucanotransferase
MVDIVRIDHFRGFEAYWEIPAAEETAINGRWVEGPGADLFDTLVRALGNLPIIAEDLGIITPAVEALRDRYNFPGMRILQFAFGNDAKAADYRPESFPPNCVVYTGTHDNDTTKGWFWSDAGENSTRTQAEIDEERKTVLSYTQTDGSQIHWDMIALACKSKANTAVFPLQDLMGLGTEARMNVPGVMGGNWRWRFTWDQLSPDLMRRMFDINHWSRRIHY